MYLEWRPIWGVILLANAIKFSIGTNILSPLQDILGAPTVANFPRQLFCLTDGEVDNTEEVLELVKKSVNQSPDSRVFTFGEIPIPFLCSKFEGIGAEASKYLVRGIAKYGRGKDEFVVSGERMETKVMRQVKRALQPILKEVKVDWSDLPVSLFVLTPTNTCRYITHIGT